MFGGLGMRIVAELAVVAMVAFLVVAGLVATADLLIQHVSIH